MKLVEDLINNTKVSGKFAAEAKVALIEYYCVTNKSRTAELDVETIEAHDFQWEIKTGAMRLKKQQELKKIVTKLETHLYAPEMNCLHFKSGKTFRVKGQTELDDAILYASIHMDKDDIERYKTDIMRHFRN